MLTRLVGHAIKMLASRAGTSVLEAAADLMVEAFEASPQLQFIVTRKVYQRSVKRISASHPEFFRPRVIDSAPLFTASNLSKCTGPGCDICRPTRPGMAN